MCEQGIVATQVWLWESGECRYRKVPVDPCIAPIVQALNDAGIGTLASCCGHGKRPGNIVLADRRELVIARDFEQGRAIDACFDGISPPPTTAEGES